MPRGKDLNQLAWLRAEIEAEGLPAVMAIAADNGAFAFMIADSGSAAPAKSTTESAANAW